MTFTRKTITALPGLCQFFACLCLCVLLACTGCGRSGMPQPPSSSKTFSWDKVEAKMAGDCILFEGVFTGAYKHFDGIRLELAGLSGPDDCPGCPFVPEEVSELSPKDAGFDLDTGSVAFTYCPRKAQAYRWRLAGISNFNRLPHATMVDRLLIATP
ncbi:hypothetical protein LJB81_01510 [Desulfovibrio sp. OttesenSCG-928-M14]|nr:hypothetical protein [Desulfovibrio sp. OttesenSCG-928-M14]